MRRFGMRARHASPTLHDVRGHGRSSPGPAVTPPGTQLRLRGLGVPSLRSGRRGDLVVEVHVEVPTRVTAEEAELLTQLAALRGEHVTPPHDGLFSRIRSAFKQ